MIQIKDVNGQAHELKGANWIPMWVKPNGAIIALEQSAFPKATLANVKAANPKVALPSDAAAPAAEVAAPEAPKPAKADKKG
jgi:hypothetical protein